MKPYYILILVLALQCTTTSKLPDSSTWKLTWVEEFEKPYLDTAVWGRIPRGKSDWNRHMSDTIDELVTFGKGTVRLHAIENKKYLNDTAKFLTGGIFTKGKKGFNNGRIEIRAKLGSAQGFWPALWMLPMEAQWPNGGEIDIMEHLNHDKVVYQTIHTYYTYVLGIKDNPKPGVVPHYNHNQWNVYGVEMYKDSLVFLVNDHPTMTYPRIQTDKQGQFPFDESDFYLLLDSQLGGSWVGKINPLELPVMMEIDWVKFYTRQ